MFGHLGQQRHGVNTALTYYHIIKLLELWFSPLNKWKSNIHSFLSSDFVFTNSCRKYRILYLLNTPLFPQLVANIVCLLFGAGHVAYNGFFKIGEIVSLSLRGDPLHITHLIHCKYKNVDISFKDTLYFCRLLNTQRVFTLLLYVQIYSPEIRMYIAWPSLSDFATL